MYYKNAERRFVPELSIRVFSGSHSQTFEGFIFEITTLNTL